MDEGQAKRESIVNTRHGKPALQLVPAEKDAGDIYGVLACKGAIIWRRRLARDFGWRVGRQIALLERPHWSRGCLCSLRTARSARRRRFEQSGELLLHRNRLRQIPRLINVAAAAYGDVIGEQLQWDDLQNGRQFFRRRRNEENVVRLFGDLFGAFGGERDDDSGTSLYFLQVRHRLLVTDHRLRAAHIARRNDDHRKILVNQRIRAVLHLSRRITFGVNIGNFLEFERAFERDGIVNAASEEEEVLRTDISFRQLVASLVVRENLFQLAGDVRKLLHGGLGLFGRHGAAHLRQIQGE